MAHISVSLPLRGPAGGAGREVLRVVELALERPGGADVDLAVLDGSGDDRDDVAETHARRAVDDREALAYVGDFHSSQVLATAPILSAAGLLQVAPVATFTGLDGSTLVRLMPNDAALARAITVWLETAGVRSVLVVHDHDDGYGVPVGRMCADAARGRGLDVRARPIWDHDEAMALVLDAIAAGEGDRERARATRDRDSVLGRYSLDDDGLTTETACGVLAVVDGELVWSR